MAVCCPMATYYMVAFAFSFTRLRPFYVINLIMPAMILSVCMILTFLLPTECGERLGYSMTILLSYTVLMTITGDMMPTTSQETPYISMLKAIVSRKMLCFLLTTSTSLSIQYSLGFFAPAHIHPRRIVLSPPPPTPCNPAHLSTVDPPRIRRSPRWFRSGILSCLYK